MGYAYCCSHGACMVVAWVGCSSIGQTVAKHYRSTWPNLKVFGKDIWFAVHWMSMVSCLIFTTTGTIVIYSKADNEQDSDAHSVLGVLVIVLAFVQPLMGTFRPGPQAKGRPYFNWAHWAVGNLVHYLAILNIILAFSIKEIYQPIDCYFVITAYIFLYFFTDFLLAKFKSERANAGSSSGNNKDMVLPFGGRPKPPTPWAVGFEPERSNSTDALSVGSRQPGFTVDIDVIVPKIVLATYVVLCLALNLLLSLMVVGTARFGTPLWVLDGGATASTVAAG